MTMMTMMLLLMMLMMIIMMMIIMMITAFWALRGDDLANSCSSGESREEVNCGQKRRAIDR